MDFPDFMTSGFNFDEAITMAELSRRVYKVFDDQQNKKVKELYNALYDDEWEFVHSMSDYKSDSRALILKRKDNNQFTIAFQGTILTSGGFEFTGQQASEDIRLMEYYPIPSEPMPPSRNARVYAGMLKAFEVFKDELELFFDLLLDITPTLKQIIGMITSDKERWESSSKLISKGASLKYNSIYSSKNYQHTKKKDFNTELDKITNSLKEEIKKLIEKNKRNLEFNKDTAKDILEQIEQAKEKMQNIIEEADLDELFKHFGPLLEKIYSLNEESSHDENEKKIRRRHTRKTKLFKSNEKFKFYITGHSRGGVLATFAALHLKRYLQSKGKSDSVSLKMYNVGSPKVGNQVFVDYYNEQMKGFSYRVQNLMDFAIYAPLSILIPFPYNMELMIPGIDYVRQGDLYYAYYQHVGESYTVVGLGNQNLDLGFGGALNLTVPVAFSHGPDGYKDMLIAARERQQVFFSMIGDFFNIRFHKQEQAFLSLYENLGEVTEKIDYIEEDQYLIFEKIDEINKTINPKKEEPQETEE